MSGLEIVLGVAALLIGLTGAWSPCGFSMVETIGPSGHSGGRRVTTAALATFVPGALIGGVLTFGALAWVGDLVHGAGGRVAFGIAAAIAIGAALLEARGVPIVPQIRRQLPEHWRRHMPMPLAAGLYGILLGLGFTTFVLSFGVWALAGIAFAVGDPAAGLVIGLAFGAGRAIPVLALAPVCQRPSGIRATEAMTQRPALYRGARGGDAVALLATAIALMVSPAGAATTVVKGAADPSVKGDELVFERANGAAILKRADGERLRVPGSDPAIGGPYLAVRQKDSIALLNRRTLVELQRFSAPGADAIAVSEEFVAWRSRTGGGDALKVRAISPGSPGGVGARVERAAPAVGEAEAVTSPDPGPSEPEPATEPAPSAASSAPRVVLGEEQVAAKASSPAQIGRPSLDERTLVYTRAGGASTSIVVDYLAGGNRLFLKSRKWLLSGASVLDGRVSYIRTTNERQEIRIRGIRDRGAGALVASVPATSYRDRDEDPGPNHNRLPTRIPRPDRARTNSQVTGTTLSDSAVYLTQLAQRAGRVSARISRVPR